MLDTSAAFFAAQTFTHATRLQAPVHSQLSNVVWVARE